MNYYEEGKQNEICSLCKKKFTNENKIEFNDCIHTICFICFKKFFKLYLKCIGNKFCCPLGECGNEPIKRIDKKDLMCCICFEDNSEENRNIFCLDCLINFKEEAPKHDDENKRSFFKLNAKQNYHLKKEKGAERKEFENVKNLPFNDSAKDQLEKNETKNQNKTELKLKNSQSNLRKYDEQFKTSKTNNEETKENCNFECRENANESCKLSSSKNSNDQIKCLICYETKDRQDILSLDCNHDFCSKCLKTDWHGKIKSKQIGRNSIFCPTCKSVISYDFLKTNLDETLFSEYDELLAQAWVFESEQKVYCPRKECSSLNLADKRLSYVTCEKCKFKFCLTCSEEWKKHSGLTCKQFKLETKKYEDPMENLIRENKWIKCPECGIIIEKTKFCNFVKCQSSLCQKKTTFCYLCGKFLKDNVNEHYVDGNTYGECYGWKN